MKITSKAIACPHCGEQQTINIDPSGGNQDYYDDCRVCCNPIHMRLHIDEANRKVEVYIDSGDEQVY